MQRAKDLAVAPPEHLTLADIMAIDVPVLPGSTDLVQVLRELERSPIGVAVCLSPSEAPRVLTRRDCSQLLISALQDFPVPNRFDQAASPVTQQMFDHQSIDQAVAAVSGDLTTHILVFRGDEFAGYVGSDQWSRLSLRFLLPPDIPDLPEGPSELTDRLTGLPDHRAYRMHLEMHLIDHFELASDLTLALIELDWLEGLARRHSESEEQATIQRVTNTVVNQLRANDSLFALEPGKWALVMADVNLSIGRSVARRLVESVWEAEFPNHGSPLGRVSISIGLATPSVDGDSTENDAEEALEQAITSGGHQVRLIGESLV